MKYVSEVDVSKIQNSKFSSHLSNVCICICTRTKYVHTCKTIHLWTIDPHASDSLVRSDRKRAVWYSHRIKGHRLIYLIADITALIHTRTSFVAITPAHSRFPVNTTRRCDVERPRRPGHCGAKNWKKSRKITDIKNDSIQDKKGFTSRGVRVFRSIAKWALEVRRRRLHSAEDMRYETKFDIRVCKKLR